MSSLQEARGFTSHWARALGDCRQGDVMTEGVTQQEWLCPWETGGTAFASSFCIMLFSGEMFCVCVCVFSVPPMYLPVTDMLLEMSK